MSNQKETNPKARICFIISPIGEPDTETRRRSDLVFRHIISPAITSLNYTPIRADQLSQPSLISRQIIRNLENSPLVIADLTDNNPNVFYELAVRHIVNKPLVPIMGKGEKSLLMSQIQVQSGTRRTYIALRMQENNLKR